MRGSGRIGLDRAAANVIARVVLALGICVASACASDRVDAPEGAAPVYTATTHTLVVGGITRSYLLAVPAPLPATPPPLVISLHGDGGNSANMRMALPLEAQAGGAAVFVYPKSHIGAFEYWNDAGRAAEAAFVDALIDAIDAQVDIDAGRVYVAGMSGGAAMANALGCRLRDRIRGIAAHSGATWTVNGDCNCPAQGDCGMPAAMLVWGKNDAVVPFNPDGTSTLTAHRARQRCAATTTDLEHSPCVAYDGCDRPVAWCAIDSLAHDIWVNAAAAIWSFIAADAGLGGGGNPEPAVWADGFEGGATLPARWIGGYYVGYERDLYPIADVDFSAITHLMVGRMEPNADGSLTRHFDINDVEGPQFAHAAIDAAHAAGRKAILMIGGAGEIEGWREAADNATRPAFVASLLAAVDEFDADGLDIDWEPLESQDHADALALLQALRAARPTLLLTFPVMWVNSNFAFNPRPVGEAAFIAAAAPLLDQINVMTYEMAAAYDGWHSWFASPLHGEAANTPSSVSSSIDYYRDAGVPAAKLGVGMGFYGNCFRNVQQPRVPVVETDFVGSDGQMSYRNIRNTYLPAMTPHFDAVAQVPWLSSAAAVGPSLCNFVTYEDAASIAAKGAYAVDEGLGGGIIWTIGQGHVPTLPARQRDPLLDAVREAFLE